MQVNTLNSNNEEVLDTMNATLNLKFIQSFYYYYNDTVDVFKNN